jgi:hypothetical protein
MAKKIYISLLALVFFISTTSIPVSVHLCSMMGLSNVESCSVCAAEKAKTINSCCKEEIAGSVNIKKAGSACCSDKLIDSSVKENFISNANGQKDISPLEYLSNVIISSDINTLSTAIVTRENIHSPPIVNSNPVYLLNSIFLI